MNTELMNLLKTVGFKNINAFKQYMKDKAEIRIYEDYNQEAYSTGFRCYTEKRQGYELSYSTNCKSVFGISGWIRGTFEAVRFN